MGGPTRRINAFLERTTGYRLVNASRNGDRDRTTTKRAPARGRTSGRPPRSGNPASGTAPRRAGSGGTGKPDFPPDYDELTADTIRAVRPYTMTSRDKLHALITAARYVHEHGVDGSVVECGVWRGGSMHAVARVLDSYGDHSRDLYLFDTFEGMPPPGEKDRRHDGRSAERLLDTSRNDKDKVRAVATLEDVRAGFSDVPYPEERVHYRPGMVEDTIPTDAPEKIAILRLDTDWYASTRHELRHLYPRLVSGGVLIIDDYGWWQGSRDATDEFLAETGEPLLLVRAGTGRIAVKP
ncbi:MAG: TylF/MycF/NovP-related O-methyltransferase [Actinocatenispora sp.]